MIAGYKKTRPKPGFFAELTNTAAVFQRFDAGVQAALVAGSLVLVDQATRTETIEQRLGRCERGFGGGGVVRVERLEHLLDGGAEHRALAGVAQIAHDGLLGALLGGLDVGHGGFLEVLMERLSGRQRVEERELGTDRPESMAVSMACVNVAWRRAA